MKYEEVTVNYLFRNSKNIHNESARIESSEKIAELKVKIGKEKPQMEWTNVSDAILKKSPELLDIKLKDILDSAWKKYRQVEQCMEQAKENPDESYLIPLLDHSIVSEHQPQIEISSDEVLLMKVNFEIFLKLELHGIILKIKGDKIEEVKAGSCQCKGMLSCEGIKLYEDSLETFEFG